MIVQCPSCHTRYRHEPVAGPPLQAGCSRCDATFPLAPALRQYVLRAPVVAPGDALPAPTGGGFRVDDPSVLDRIRIPVPAPEPGVFEELAIPAAAAVPVEPAQPIAEPASVPAVDAAVAVPAPAEPAGAKRPPRSRRLGGNVVVGLPAAAGAVLAYTVARLTGSDPLTWAALGGALGLLVGWVCLSWIVRED